MLTIRPAQPDDRPAMERICAHTWEWGDYVPDVWDDWLAGEAGSRAEDRSMAGPAIVGEMAGQVVALSKITFLTPGQVWLEGMHVDPEFRHRGIAGHFLDYSLAYARDHGARVVRTGTGGNNTAVHTLMARAGMERIGTYLAADGRVAALATVHLEPGDKRMWVGFADGPVPAVVELAMAIRAHAARIGAEDVSTMLPDLPWLRDAFGTAGYGQGDWEGELWIFERFLEPGGGGGA
jgi:GNAT superfamily N-acetyltransferase